MPTPELRWKLKQPTPKPENGAAFAGPSGYAAYFRNENIILRVPQHDEWGNQFCEHAIDFDTADRLIDELFKATLMRREHNNKIRNGGERE